jgi:hypothetical protein
VSVIARELWWMNQEWLELRRGNNRSDMVVVYATPVRYHPIKVNLHFPSPDDSA